MHPDQTPASSPGPGAGNGQLPAAYRRPVLPPPPRADDPDVAVLQAVVEGAPQLTDSVEFMGARFRVADNVGLMPLLKFAHAADKGIRAEDFEGMAAMYAMIRDCIYPGHECTCGAEMDPASGYTSHRQGCEFDAGDWARFERHAIDQRADADDLFALINNVMEMVTARPTPPRSGSLPQAPSPSPRSRASSPSQAAGLVPVEDLVRSAE